MKISILLPYKENYSPDYAGAVSLFINSVSNVSIFKNSIKIFGSTNYKKKLSKNYINIDLKKKLFSSQSNDYVNKFIKLQNKDVPDIIEIHNRPNYIENLISFKSKLVLYFHNDPITMEGSKTTNQIIRLLEVWSKIILKNELSKNK